MTQLSPEQIAPEANTPALTSQVSTIGLEAEDVIRLLHLMGDLASMRNDPRAWRLELLTALTSLLNASVAAAFILKSIPEQKSPLVVSIFDAGFKLPEQREAFLQEFNTAPFQDPLSRIVLDTLAAVPASPCPTITAARADFFDDAAWEALPHIQQYRRLAGLRECLISAQRRPLGEGGEPGRNTIMLLCVFKPWEDPRIFTDRQRAILNTFHAGLGWMYRAEESTHRLTRASALSPRLRQTLEYLLAGDTEREVAVKMAISAHTVHDYVKALYVHFGVSSRSELLARWLQSGGQPPAPPQDCS